MTRSIDHESQGLPEERQTGQEKYVYRNLVFVYQDLRSLPRFKVTADGRYHDRDGSHGSENIAIFCN